MGFLNLFAVSSIPVLKVLLVTGLGSYLALDRIDILGDDARKHLNNIVFFVFNPALISSNLAKTITYESMVQMWFMPFNILITFIIGCCAAGNLGNMLFIIIPAVCKERGSPFGDPDVCSKYGMAYASLSMAGAIYLWSYVYNIIRISSSRNTKEVEINDFSITKSPKESSIVPSGWSSTEPLLSSNDITGSEDHLSEHQPNQLALPQTRFEEKPQVSFLDKIKQHLETFLRKMNLKRLFAPSTTGAIVGFIVGLVPQIRKLLIGETAPLHVIQDTSLLLGDGAIPAITLIMGGNLLKGLKGSGIQKSIILGILIVRYVALPLLGIVVVKGALHFGLVHHNPLYQFVLLLQFALPPAMNIGTEKAATEFKCFCKTELELQEPGFDNEVDLEVDLDTSS
ncbi:Auxin efflux carrier family protein [Forsythia ovata]|uniref:Auxin efflux carrier family protein n=1 Tax=Forsythia ovata TaxID=205694 RepID=A0ABD1UYI9_9LAMI